MRPLEPLHAAPRLRSVGRRLRREDRAAAMLEFAIVLPLLLALVFGAIEYGRVFFLYNNLSTAAREGARRAAVMSLGTAAEITAATPVIEADVRSRISDPGAADAVVTFTPPAGPDGAQTVRVSIVSYPFPRAVPFIAPDKIPTVTAEFRYELQ
jgi:Flp pilus assembly protein TadG